MTHYRTIPSPVGLLTLAERDNKLIAITWGGSAASNEESPFLINVENQLREYFNGQRKEFTIPLYPVGTEFQEKVWKCLLQIPYGKTCSYAEIAEKIGNPAAVRAVGTAIGNNPISIIIPCHRVIGKDGSLTGFAGGLENKRALLELERISYRLQI